MGNLEDVRLASTIEEVRAEILRQYTYSPFVRSDMHFAEHQQWSDENMYAYLAYHLLKSNNELTALLLAHKRMNPAPHIVPAKYLEE